ncbi:MAG: STAS domain-containing protein [Terriglobales bacterium]
MLLNAVMSKDKRHIQIDLSGVSTIDAGGLGVLASLERWARDGHRTLHIVNPSKHVSEALDATGLSSVLQVRPANQDRSQKAGDAA